MDAADGHDAPSRPELGHHLLMLGTLLLLRADDQQVERADEHAEEEDLCQSVALDRASTSMDKRADEHPQQTRRTMITVRERGL